MTVLVLASHCGSDWRTMTRPHEPPGEHQRPEAIRVTPHRAAALTIPDGEWTPVLASLRETIMASEDSDVPAALVHALRLDGADAALEVPGIGFRRISELLRDTRLQRQRYGNTFLRLTREGARYTWPTLIYAYKGSLRESHFDQIFASLAECGVSLDADIWTESGPGTVNDLLRDALATFDSNRQELEWTMIALAIYMPPRTEWIDRFNRRHDMDALAKLALDAALERRSCGGTHMWYAMLVLLRAHLAEPFLSSDLADALLVRVCGLRDAALATQRPDGAWCSAWTTPPPDGTRASILVTSHVAECLLYLPEPLLTSATRRALSSAGAWLWERLQHYSNEEESIRQQLLCPLTHAACVVRQLRR
jgi:hypothetical protein